jgi:chromosome segregation ATPase
VSWGWVRSYQLVQEANAKVAAAEEETRLAKRETERFKTKLAEAQAKLEKVLDDAELAAESHAALSLEKEAVEFRNANQNTSLRNLFVHLEIATKKNDELEKEVTHQKGLVSAMSKEIELLQREKEEWKRNAKFHADLHELERDIDIDDGA